MPSKSQYRLITCKLLPQQRSWKTVERKGTLELNQLTSNGSEPGHNEQIQQGCKHSGRPPLPVHADWTTGTDISITIYPHDAHFAFASCLRHSLVLFTNLLFVSAQRVGLPQVTVTVLISCPHQSCPHTVHCLQHCQRGVFSYSICAKRQKSTFQQWRTYKCSMYICRPIRVFTDSYNLRSVHHSIRQLGLYCSGI